MNLHLIHTNLALAACWLAETSRSEVAAFLAYTKASHPALGSQAAELALAINHDFPGYLPSNQIISEEWQALGAPGALEVFAFLVEAEIRTLNPAGARLPLLSPGVNAPDTPCAFLPSGKN